MVVAIISGGLHDDQPLPENHDGEIALPASGSKSWSVEFEHGHLEITHSFEKSFGRHLSLSAAVKISPDEREATHQAIAHARILKRKDTFEMRAFFGGELKYSSKGEFRTRGPVFGVGGILHF